MDLHIVAVTEDEFDIVDVGSTYVLGGGGGGGGTFILDVTSSGVVGEKSFETAALLACSTDTSTIRVFVGCEGDSTEYTPSVTVNGVNAPLTETSTKRWFTGYAEITLALTGQNSVVALSSTGSSWTTLVNRLEGGPEIIGVVFGAYPGVQTQLKAGDTISMTVTTAIAATEVTISAAGVATMAPLAVSGGTATGTLTIGSFNGDATFTVTARNAFGTLGSPFTTPVLHLNQTYPSFSAFTVTYPATRGALREGEQANVACTVFNADTVSYSVTGLGLDSSDYAVTKTVTNNITGYVNSGSNYQITANRAANNATSSANTLVKIATVSPTAYVTSPVRLLSSPTGTDHEIRIYPNQVLSGAPTLSASVGAWQGSWTLVGTYWRRNLRITDADPKGAGLFSALSMTGLSGLPGSTITSGENYVVGGMSARLLTFPPFSRVTALGCAVGDRTKTYASIVGGDVLTRIDSNANVLKGYYIADAGGAYNPNGTYLGLSDTALAGANTSGTLQASFEEQA